MTISTGKTIHSSRTKDLNITIRDEGVYRSLYFGNECLQGRMLLSQPETLVLSYTQIMLLPLAVNPEPLRILCVGLGAGSFVRFFQHHFPAAHIVAVDSSPQVIELAKQYFLQPAGHFDTHSNVRVVCEDGATFLKNQLDEQLSEQSSKAGSSPADGYDIILIDAFDEQGMAGTIYDASFLELCRASLSEKGIVSCNLWSGDKTRLRSLKQIFENIFATPLILPVPARGNIIAIMAGPQMRDELFRRIKSGKNKDLESLSRRLCVDLEAILSAARSHNNFLRLKSFGRKLLRRHH